MNEHFLRDLLGIDPPSAKLETEDCQTAGLTISNTTDVSNAERLNLLHGSEIRYCRPKMTWLIWNGKRWEPDRTGMVMHFARHAVRQIYHEVAEAKSDKEGAALLKHAKASLSNFSLQAMVEQASSFPSLAVVPEQFDEDPWLLNVGNGIVDLRSGNITPHRPSALMTKMANASLRPEAECPKWMEFLHQIMGGDKDVVSYLQRLIGYCLCAVIREHILVLMHGPGANGKSTFLIVIREILGTYASMMPPEMLIAKKFGGSSHYEAAELAGVRLAIDSEVDEGRRFDVAKMKRLTGGDRIKARRPYEQFIEFTPYFKLILGLNNLPSMSGSDAAAWRRVHLVPCNVVIPPAQQDPELKDKLLRERDGILKWAVEGCLEWQRNGLMPPKAVLAATQEYRAEMDAVGTFITTCCTTSPNDICTSKDLYTAYRTWCEAEGVTPTSHCQFGRDMRARGFDKGKTRVTRLPTYKGIDVTNVWRGKASLPGREDQKEQDKDAEASRPAIKNPAYANAFWDQAEEFVRCHVRVNKRYCCPPDYVHHIYREFCKSRNEEPDYPQDQLVWILLEVFRFKWDESNEQAAFADMNLEHPKEWDVDV